MSKREKNNLSDSEDLRFAAEAIDEPDVGLPDTWKVIIADDEEGVHTITRMVLQDFTFEGRHLELVSTYSGKETKLAMVEHPDAALLLLDVVMEAEDSGLDVARYVREELDNGFVRIILRTGQPGQAPEREVITDYDINDYKEKTELTANKLFTAVTTALRSYRDLRTIDMNRRGLEKVIEASGNLFEIQSLRQFTTGLLTQMVGLLQMREDAVYLQTSGFAATETEDGYSILAATGRYADKINQPVSEVLPAKDWETVKTSIENREDVISEREYAGYFKTKCGTENLLFMAGERPLSKLDKDLLKVFSANVSIAFDNIFLNKEIINTQKELIYTMSAAAETRSQETANHVKRVGEICYVLAKKLGLTEDNCELLRLAAPMHDVGKIGIPDAILNKPGPLTPNEFEIMKTHSRLGHNIFKGSSGAIMQAADLVAMQHHERWNGKGYPLGLRGEQIHIFGRICGIADVYDALGSNRVYKEAWNLERVLELIKSERGEHFDPDVVDAFMESLDEILAIGDALPDEILDEDMVEHQVAADPVKPREKIKTSP